MATIKPAEVSAILLDELTNFENNTSLDVKGTVLNVGDGVARVYGMRDVEAGELVEFQKAVRATDARDFIVLLDAVGLDATMPD